MSENPKYINEKQRLLDVYDEELKARQASYDMHGGDARAPFEKEMPQIITQFGDWAVTPHGVECLTYPYQIQWDSLTDPIVGDEFWLEKLADKDWVNIQHAMEAIRHGRRIHRYLQEVGSNNDLENSEYH